MPLLSAPLFPCIDRAGIDVRARPGRHQDRFFLGSSFPKSGGVSASVSLRGTSYSRSITTADGSSSDKNDHMFFLSVERHHLGLAPASQKRDGHGDVQGIHLALLDKIKAHLEPAAAPPDRGILGTQVRESLPVHPLFEEPAQVLARLFLEQTLISSQDFIGVTAASEPTARKNFSFPASCRST